MHPSTVHVASVLRELGVPGEVIQLPEPAPTAATAAAQLGCEVGAIANSLIFNADAELAEHAGDVNGAGMHGARLAGCRPVVALVMSGRPGPAPWWPGAHPRR